MICLIFTHSCDSKEFPSVLSLPFSGLKLLFDIFPEIFLILLPKLTWMCRNKQYLILYIHLMHNVASSMFTSWMMWPKSYSSGWTSTEWVERWKLPGNFFISNLQHLIGVDEMQIQSSDYLASKRHPSWLMPSGVFTVFSTMPTSCRPWSSWEYGIKTFLGVAWP